MKMRKTQNDNISDANMLNSGSQLNLEHLPVKLFLLFFYFLFCVKKSVNRHWAYTLTRKKILKKKIKFSLVFKFT